MADANILQLLSLMKTTVNIFKASGCWAGYYICVINIPFLKYLLILITLR